MRRSLMAACIGLALICFSSSLFAQPPDTLWTRTFGTNRPDQGFDVQQTLDGGYVLAGYTTTANPDNSLYNLIKTNANGTMLWSRTWNHSDLWDECYVVQQTPDSGYVLAGGTYSFAADWDFWVVKTNANGDSLWSRTIGGPDADQCYSLQTVDGGFVFAGATRSFGNGNWKMWMVRTDANGDSLWTRTFNGGFLSQCNTVCRTADDGYALAGYTMYGDGNSDFYLVNTDVNGDTLWTRTFGGARQQICYSIEQTSDGGYILAGTTSPANGDIDAWLVKTDANGNELWNRQFGGNTYDEFRSVRQTLDGGYIVAGFTQSFGAGFTDWWIIKTDANGDSLWSRTYGGAGSENCRSVQQTSDGGYVFAGITSSFGVGSTDFWLVKTAPDHPLPSIVVTSPNGGEFWTVGQTQTVEWITNDVEGTVNIHLNRDYPNGAWDLLGQRDEDEPSLEWIVTAPVSVTCRIRVENADSTDVFDISNADFSIVQRSIRLNPPVIDFGEVPVDSQAVALLWIVSTGLSWLTVDSVICTPGPFSAWELVADIAPGESLSVLASFTPTDTTLRMGVITVYSNAGDSTVVCRGRGILETGGIRNELLPNEYSLSVYPNPFNPSTEIRYVLPRAGHVTLRVVDVLGRHVTTLVDRIAEAGAHRVTFDGTELSSGCYFVRFESPQFNAEQKIILVK